jgi:hypothetical protein
MLAKRFAHVSLGILALALAYHFGASSATAQAPSQKQIVNAASTGRWTIVNGTPEMASNIMLLDTFTGDSWISCEDPDGTTEWCRIPRSEGASKSKK